MSRYAIFPVASVLLLVAGPCGAWAELGHQLVGELAQRQLTPVADAQVRALLRDETVPTLAGVATWADDLRTSDPVRGKATARWHYVNLLGESCRFVAVRDCPDGACVLGAIDAQSRVLRDDAQPFGARRDALKFLVHFVGDVHQPLHSSNRPDKGANEFQIALRTGLPPGEFARERYKDGIMGTNLHTVWDYFVLSSAKLPFDDYADRLSTASRSPSPQSSPDGWAAESCELIERHAIYPRSHALDAKYLDSMRPLAERRIAQAAERLARLLNEVLGPRAKDPLAPPSPNSELSSPSPPAGPAP
jgi:hypothetical protein